MFLLHTKKVCKTSKVNRVSKAVKCVHLMFYGE